ncbi:hypothetical protein [Algisphaera agarilytica]|uniref:Uncharacterized protein n=1 Tax=Algisphaera agarilytica TaxID=1385975 RepID=A0A7X0LKR9_9BACT|nr:hypothetical protein [Algisphaera agarilytica]MBB6429228.1 hypothetical protein [Algisphaera agarilytica]
MIAPTQAYLLQCASHGSGPETLFASWSIHHGWQRQIDRMQAIVDQYGPRVIDWHLPFGHTGDWPYLFSQARSNRYTKTAPESMKPKAVEAVLSSWHKRNPDSPIRVYIGDMEHDPALRDANNPDQRNTVITDSLKPLYDSGVRMIGLDRSATYAAGTWMAETIQAQAANGANIYLEAWPEHEWQSGYNVIGAASTLARMDPSVHADSAALGRLQPDKLGEVVAYCFDTRHVEAAVTRGWIPSANIYVWQGGA